MVPHPHVMRARGPVTRPVMTMAAALYWTYGQQLADRAGAVSTPLGFGADSVVRVAREGVRGGGVVRVHRDAERIHAEVTALGPVLAGLIIQAGRFGDSPSWGREEFRFAPVLTSRGEPKVMWRDKQQWLCPVELEPVGCNALAMRRHDYLDWVDAVEHLAGVFRANPLDTFDVAGAGVMREPWARKTA